MRQLSEPYTRVQAPAGLNYTPETFKRRMSDTVRDADPWHKPEKKRGGWRYPVAAVIAGAAAVMALTGCAPVEEEDDSPGSTASVQMAEIKRAAAGAWACPGMHSEWISETEVMCLKETK